MFSPHSPAFPCPEINAAGGLSIREFAAIQITASLAKSFSPAAAPDRIACYGRELARQAVTLADAVIDRLRQTERAGVAVREDDGEAD